MIKTKKVNNVKVKAIPSVKQMDRTKICGGDLFDLYCNIAIIGKKKSGKTSLIREILKRCTNRLTTVIIFSNTIYNDSSWVYICDELERQGIPLVKHTNLYDDETKENLLDAYVALFRSNAKEEEEQKKSKHKEKKPAKYIILDEDKHETKPKLPKKIAPDYIFVFDDFGGELQDRSLSHLLKQHRHYKTKIIISTQYYNDIPNSGRSQVDYWCLYPKISIEKIDQLHHDLGLSIDQDLFKKIYLDSTKEKYNFLFIDRVNDRYYHNFNEEYQI